MAEVLVPEPVQVDVATGLLRRGLVLFGDFTLASGAWSPMYVDLRRASSAVEANKSAPNMSKEDQIKFRNDVVIAYASMLEGLQGQYQHIQDIPEAVAGIVPMVGHVTGDSVLHRRVKMKEHGVGRDGILGDYNEGDATILLDDLISTSGSKVKEKTLVEDISKLRDNDGTVVGAGLVVDHALILLDRETGGIESARESGLEVLAAVTISQVLEIGQAEGLISDRQFQIVQGYREGHITSPADIDSYVS